MTCALRVKYCLLRGMLYRVMKFDILIRQNSRSLL